VKGGQVPKSLKGEARRERGRQLSVDAWPLSLALSPLRGARGYWCVSRTILGRYFIDFDRLMASGLVQTLVEAATLTKKPRPGR
jgi:hypothetical protein